MNILFFQYPTTFLCLFRLSILHVFAVRSERLPPSPWCDSPRTGLPRADCQNTISDVRLLSYQQAATEREGNNATAFSIPCTSPLRPFVKVSIRIIPEALNTCKQSVHLRTCQRQHLGLKAIHVHFPLAASPVKAYSVFTVCPQSDLATTISHRDKRPFQAVCKKLPLHF